MVQGKESAGQCRNLRDSGLIPELGRFHGGRNGNPLQYSCLETSMDSLWGHKQSDTTEQLTTHARTRGYSCCSVA